jgi:hypothetical protein
MLDAGAPRALVEEEPLPKEGARRGFCGCGPQVCFEPAGAVATTNWKFVGQGKGNYDVVKTYTYVGTGYGTHEKAGEEAWISGCTRWPNLWCSCIVALVLSSLVCLVLAFTWETQTEAPEDFEVVSAGDEVVSSFVPGYGYKGPLKVTGFLKVTSEGVGATASQVLAWKLQGADPRCNGTSQAGVANSCGVCIASSSDCQSEPDSNLHAVDSPDPWGSVVYTMRAGSSFSAGTTVRTGLLGEDLTGHALIVYDSVGSSLACGILTATVPASR